MGFTKRLIEKQEEQRVAARDIAIAAGVLKPCEFHEDCIIDCGADIEAAYKLGNHRFSAGSLGECFDTRREMTDCINSVVQQTADRCWICAKILHD